MDQINGWPKQLPCLFAMTGSRREQFRHFVLMSEVSSAVASCKPPLNYAHSCPLYRFSLYVFLLRPVLVSLNTHISRSDPFVGNYCIFNPDLDNDAVTVIFAPGPFAALRPLLSLTLCIPSLPIIATLTNSEERHNRSCLSATLYVQLRVFFLSFWTLFTIPSHWLWVSSCLTLTGGPLFYSGNTESVIQPQIWGEGLRNSCRLSGGSKES